MDEASDNLLNESSRKSGHSKLSKPSRKSADSKNMRNSVHSYMRYENNVSYMSAKDNAAISSDGSDNSVPSSSHVTYFKLLSEVKFLFAALTILMAEICFIHMEPILAYRLVEKNLTTM